MNPWLQTATTPPQSMPFMPPVMVPRPPPTTPTAVDSRYSAGGSSGPSTSSVTVSVSVLTPGPSQYTVFEPWMRNVLPSGSTVGAGNGIHWNGSVPWQAPIHGGASELSNTTSGSSHGEFWAARRNTLSLSLLGIVRIVAAVGRTERVARPADPDADQLVRAGRCRAR